MKKLLFFFAVAMSGFVFSQMAPAVTIFPTTEITTASAKLNFDTASNGAATTIYLSYSTSPGMTGFTQIASQTGSSMVNRNFVVSGLLPNTTYFFSIKVVNNYGTSTQSNFFTTASGLANTLNLIGKYRFSPNSVMNDESGNNNLLTTTGSLAVQTNDKLGNANSAAQMNGFYKFQNTSTQYKPSSVSIAAWVYKTAVQGYSTIAGYRYNEQISPYNSYLLFSGSTNNNKLGFNFSTDLAGDLSVTSTATLNLNTWYHVVATYNASNGNAKLYINGVLDNSATFSPSSIAYLGGANNNSFCIGAINYINNAAFIGTLDEVFVYGRAISQTEVTNLYNSTYLASQELSLNNPKIAMYPNPATDYFTITTEKKVKAVEIYSMNGQKTLTSMDKKVNIQGLEKGIYLVKIQVENQATSIQKLMVK